MTNYRYAVVPVGADGESQGMLRDLDAIPGFVRAEAADGALQGIDAIIVVAGPAHVRGLLERVAALRAARPDCAVLVAGRGFDASQWCAVLAAGAHDFVESPFSPEALRARLRRAMGLVPNDALPRVREALSPPMRAFIGASPVFAKQIGKIPTIAGCDAGVLILGETGTGKEVCAQAVHYLSARASKPWIAVNCGAIPLELVESELFGHVKGAYTTAHAAREGLVAEAEGGTLFLDDIDCLPLSAQAKLLRFVQEREYRMVGANSVRRADVRVIAASNRDLAAMVAGAGFRRDLYFRLNVLTLTLPALRERREDVPALALHFVQQFARKFGRPACSLSPQALKKLLVHDWPGNVRELQHVIERATLLCAGPSLGAEDIDIPGAAPQACGEESFRTAKERLVQQFERTYIEHLLATCKGNVTHAAHEARKNRRAFFALIRKHGIAVERFRPDK